MSESEKITELERKVDSLRDEVVRRFATLEAQGVITNKSLADLTATMPSLRHDLSVLQDRFFAHETTSKDTLTVAVADIEKLKKYVIEQKAVARGESVKWSAIIGTAIGTIGVLVNQLFGM